MKREKGPERHSADPEQNCALGETCAWIATGRPAPVDWQRSTGQGMIVPVPFSFTRDFPPGTRTHAGHEELPSSCPATRRPLLHRSNPHRDERIIGITGLRLHHSHITSGFGRNNVHASPAGRGSRSPQHVQVAADMPRSSGVGAPRARTKPVHVNGKLCTERTSQKQG